MAKSKIIKDLVTGNITVLQALDRLLVISMELGDEGLLKWVQQEKNGYSQDDDVPTYRLVSMHPIGTFQLISMGTITTCKNRTIPTIISFFPDISNFSVANAKLLW